LHRHLIDVKLLEAHEQDRRHLLRLPLLCLCGTAAIDMFVNATLADVVAFWSGSRLLPEARSFRLQAPNV
jgi:hypothetical protein